MRDAGHRRRRFGQPPVQFDAPLGLDTAAHRVHVDDQHLLSIESEPQRGEPAERPHEESCGDDEHEGQRDLRDDQAARDADAAIARRGPSVFL